MVIQSFLSHIGDAMTQFAKSAATPARNAAALWALILGIAALVLSLAVIGGLLGVVAIIVAIVGLTRPGRKGHAVTGLITGVASLPIAFLAIFIWAAILIPMSTGRAGQARRTSTEVELANLQTAIVTFEVDVLRFPTTDEGLQALVVRPRGIPAGKWRGPYIQKLPNDSWGRPFIYLCPGMEPGAAYDVFSVGPDGVPGTPDDIKPRRF
jgi:general secretion pathway protein G